MPERLCRFLSQGLSPQATALAALGLAALMVFADADQTTCFVALIFLLTTTRRDGACRLFGRSRH